MVRAVVDANGFVSALFRTTGSPAKVVDALLDQIFDLVILKEVLAETNRVLS